MKKYLCLILIALAAAGCIYPFDADLGDGDVPDRLVVSGDVLIGEETRITLGYVAPLGTLPGEMRKNFPTGSVILENDLGQRFVGARKSTGGVYVIDTRTAPENARYRLTISLSDGREYATPWSGVYQAPVITDLSYAMDESNLALLLSLDGADSLWNFRWDYTETWEYHAWFVPNVMFVPGLPADEREKPSKIYRIPEPEEADDFYFCWNSKDSVEPFLASAEGQSENRIKDCNFLSMSRGDNRLMTLYSILVTVRGISSDGRAYLHHQSVVSNGTGDLFSPTPSEMPGNVRCTSDPSQLAIGYVEVCKRTSRRIFIGSSGVYQSRFDPETLLYFPEADEDGNYNYDSIFVNDSPVMVMDEVPTQTNVKWGPKRCVDCRAWGGSKSKPDWWPNDDK